MADARTGALKLCIFVGVNVGGYIGWSLGERYGIGTALILSGIGSILGVLAGWKVARSLLE
jgi:hypothetical protein